MVFTGYRQRLKPCKVCAGLDAS